MKNLILKTGLVGAILLSSCNMNMTKLEKRPEYAPEMAQLNLETLYNYVPEDILSVQTIDNPRKFKFYHCKEIYRKDSVFVDGRFASAIVYDRSYLPGPEIVTYWDVKNARSHNESTLESTPFQVMIFRSGQLIEKYSGLRKELSNMKRVIRNETTGAVESFARQEIIVGFKKLEIYSYRNKKSDNLLQLIDPTNQGLSGLQE